jgi:K+-sensing histidine kinase KdpD
MSDSPVVKYGLALLAVAVALVLRLWLNPFIGLDAPFLTFFLAVMAAAAYGGFGPGLLAAFASSRWAR